MKRKSRPSGGAGGRRPLWRFLLLTLLALLLQGLGWAAQMLPGEGGLVCYFAVLYAGAPLAAAGLGWWAGRGGVHPMAAFFPVGGALLLLPVYHSPGMGLLCLLLSLVGATAGQEWEKRGQEKGRKHGRKK